MGKIIRIALKNTLILFVVTLMFDSITYAFCFSFTGITRSDIFNKLQGTDTLINANIVVLVLCSTLLPLAVNLTKHLSGFLFSTVQQNISNNIRNYIYDRVFNIPINNKMGDLSGEIITRFRDDVQDIGNFFNAIYIQIPKLLMSVINLYVMFRISSILSLAVVIPLLIVVFTIHFLQGRLVKNKLLARKATDKATKFLGDIFSSIDAVKLSDKKDNYLKHYRELCVTRGKYAIKDAFLQKLLSIFSLNLMFLALAVILFFTQPLIRKGIFTIGNFILFEYYFWFLTDLPNVFSSIYSSYKQMSVAERRIAEFEHLAADNVYHYNFDNELLMQISKGNYNFDNNVLYLVTGKNGSGKSTLLKNFFSNSTLCPPDICYLSQTAHLISGSVKDNICMGMEYDEKKVEYLLELVSLRQEIVQEKLSLDSLVGDSGEQLSGGQKKRLTLARLLYRDPSVIVLDDVTSGLDIVTERKVIENLSKLKNKKVILASNSESLKSYAVQIISI